MNTPYSEAGEEKNPPLEPFSTLFDEHRAGKVTSTVGEGRLSISNTTSWKVCHVWIHQLGTTNLAEEAVADNSPYCHSCTDNPEHFSKVSEDMFNTHMAITSMLMANNQGSDGMISRDDHLMLGGVRYRSVLQTTANSEDVIGVDEWRQGKQRMTFWNTLAFS